MRVLSQKRVAKGVFDSDAFTCLRKSARSPGLSTRPPLDSAGSQRSSELVPFHFFVAFSSVLLLYSSVTFPLTRVDAEEAFSQSLKRFQTTIRSLILDP